MEKIGNQTEEPLEFKVEEIRPGVTVYHFDQVGIVFDSTHRNQEDYVELSFGTFDPNVSIEEQTGAEFFQKKELGVDMLHIKHSMEKAALDYGENTFWIYPWDDDGHGEARLRLFRRFSNIEPDGHDFGYILKV